MVLAAPYAPWVTGLPYAPWGGEQNGFGFAYSRKSSCGCGDWVALP